MLALWFFIIDKSLGCAEVIWRDVVKRCEVKTSSLIAFEVDVTYGEVIVTELEAADEAFEFTWVIRVLNLSPRQNDGAGCDLTIRDGVSDEDFVNSIVVFVPVVLSSELATSSCGCSELSRLRHDTIGVLS